MHDIDWRKPQSSRLDKRVKMGRVMEAKGAKPDRSCPRPGERHTAAMRLFCAFTLSFIPALVTGCSYFNKTPTATGDPLLGGPPTPAPLKTGQPQPTTTPVTVLPPMPAPNFSSSPAALASGPSRPSDNSRDLRIGSPQPGTDGWAGRDPSSQANGATLTGIQPSSDTVSRPDSQPVANPVSLSGSQVTTNEQAQAILKSRGVIWQRLDQVANTGEWKFSCSLPNPQNPRLHRTYEATAPDSLGATRAVLDKIEKDQ
jgi:hypothetical protein